ncbi:MAG: MotA/TolQ/ExbB proton channel family protein, partial [Alphaproteobacteria bacterium]|nr:MotA/TolQ/ExbB proton channel family protein [Alphaproteobacteria bacterium]
PVRAQNVIDGMTIIGISLALVLTIVSMFLSGVPGAYFDLRSVMIVFGGTVGVTIASFTLHDSITALSFIRQATSKSYLSPSQVAMQMLDIALFARRRGLLKLESLVDIVNDRPILFKGISMAVDGIGHREIRDILGRESVYHATTRERSINFLRQASEIAPAMGLAGTLIGLVQMLANLEEANLDSIGPAMALALLTTLYGVMLANMIFTPIANKLYRNGEDDDLLNTLYILTSLSIQKQENPRRLELDLNAILPTRERINYFQ